LTLLVGRQEGHPACKKTEWWGAGMVICLERVADLHMSQLMPLPLTVYCFSKIQIVFAFLVPVYPGSPGKRAVKWVCSCNILVLKVIFKAVSFEASTILLKKRFISLSHFAANFCSNCCKWQNTRFCLNLLDNLGKEVSI